MKFLSDLAKYVTKEAKTLLLHLAHGDIASEPVIVMTFSGAVYDALTAGLSLRDAVIAAAGVILRQFVSPVKK